MEKIERKYHKFDATGKAFGRLATEIARLLQGKHKPAYLPNIDVGDFVEVINVAAARLTGKKMDQKVYRHHTGYPGSLKEVPVRRIFESKPEEILRRAVYQMLPKNKLRNERMKRLIIS